MTTASLAPGRGPGTRREAAGGAEAPRPLRVPAPAVAGGRALLGLACIAYAMTSGVVLLNATGNATGVVWLPSFPDWYYAATAALYLPFGWWFALLAPVRAMPGIDYATFAWLSRAPFVAAPLALLVATRAVPARRATVGATAFAGLVAVADLGALGVLALGRLSVREAVESAAREAGPWGPALLLALMAAQAVPTPVPTVAITLAAGLLYGVGAGAALAWSGAMVAAAISFWLGRGLGRPAVARLGGARALDAIDRWSTRGAFRAVLVARLVPAVSFRATSLAAGLLPIRLVPFLVATGIGQLPATIAYAALGASLVGDASAIAWAAGGVGLLAAVIWLARAWIAASPSTQEAAVMRVRSTLASGRVRVGGSAALLAFLGWRLGAGQIGAALRDADVAWLAAGAVATVAALAVSAWKWQLLLRAAGVEAGLGTLFEAYLVGQFFNNFLPSNVGGDVARAHVVGRATGSVATVAGTVVGERLVAGLALVATALAALAASPWLAGTVGIAVLVTGVAFVGLTVAAGAAPLRERAVKALGRRGRRGAIARALEGLGASLARPAVVAPVFALSVAFQALVIAVAWCGLQAVGADVPLDAAIALVPVISAIQLVPVSVGGLGVREGAYAVLFGACCGVAAPVSVAASLAFAGIVGAVSLAGGARFAWRGRPSSRTAVPEDEAMAAVIRRVERETWFDADWLWTFAGGMRSAGRTHDQTISALRRQGQANRLPALKRVVRRAQLSMRAVTRAFTPPADPA